MEDKKREKIENFIFGIIEKYTWGYLFNKLIYFLNPFNILKFFINFIYFIKRNILNLLYLLFDFKEKDTLWINAKKRFFFTKIKHFFILMSLSYFGLGYLYDMYSNRYWAMGSYSQILILSKKTYESNLLKVLVPIKGRNEKEEPWHYRYYFERFQLSHILDMWVHILSIIIIINVLFFISFFSRNVHEAIYNFDVVLLNGFILYAFCHGFNVFFIKYCFYYLELFNFTAYYLINFSLLLLYCMVAWFSEDPEDYTDSFLNQLFFKASDFENDLDVLPEITPYDGTLHKLPNIYTIDTTYEVQKLIQTRKDRHAAVVEGGLAYEIYYRTFWKWDWNKEIVENISHNWNKAVDYYFYFVVNQQIVFIAESLYEFLNRYYKSISFIAEVEYGFRADQYIISNIPEEIEMLPWYDEMRFGDKEKKSLFLYNSWLKDLPLFIRWGYLLYWFYIEYNLNKIIVKYDNFDKKIKIVPLWSSLKRFFGFEVVEKQIYKYKDGYVKFDIVPRVYLKTDFEFDWDLYSKPDLVYDSISVQINKLLIKLFHNIIYFFLNFFGSFKFWISILLFWRKGSFVRQFFYWLFIDVILNFIFFLLKFIKSLPYRMYTIICFINECVYIVFLWFYYVNIFYWSFLLNCLCWIRFVYRICLKKNRPSGSFNYFNSSPWRQYKVDKFWRGFLLLFKKYIPKVSILGQKKFYLVWFEKRKIK